MMIMCSFLSAMIAMVSMTALTEISVPNILFGTILAAVLAPLFYDRREK